MSSITHIYGHRLISAMTLFLSMSEEEMKGFVIT